MPPSSPFHLTALATLLALAAAATIALYQPATGAPWESPVSLSIPAALAEKGVNTALQP